MPDKTVSQRSIHDLAQIMLKFSKIVVASSLKISEKRQRIWRSPLEFHVSLLAFVPESGRNTIEGRADYLNAMVAYWSLYLCSFGNLLQMIVSLINPHLFGGLYLSLQIRKLNSLFYFQILTELNFTTIVLFGQLSIVI